MTQITGQVTAIKTRNTKIGDMYDLVVDGKSYGHGKFAPRGVKEGDFVTFEFTTKVNGQWTNLDIVPKTLRVESAPTEEQKTASKAATTLATAAADKKQETISRQSALNTATAIVALQLQYGGLKFPATAKAPDVFSVIEGAVFDVASRVYKANTGDTWDVPTEKVSKPVAKREAAPTASDDAGYDEYQDAP